MNLRQYKAIGTIKIRVPKNNQLEQISTKSINAGKQVFEE